MRKNLSLLLIVVIANLTTVPITVAHATLIVLDFYEAGDRLITLDTITGLEWLDVTETQGMSYTDVWNNSQLDAEGWQHATNYEVSDLFNQYVRVDNLTEMQGYFGMTHFFGSFWMTHGFIEHLDGRSQYGDAFIKREGVGGGIWEVRDFSSWNSSYAEPNVGHWSVRQAPAIEPVPEPSTVLLVGTGLIGLAGFRKKFKK